MRPRESPFRRFQVCRVFHCKTSQGSIQAHAQCARSSRIKKKGLDSLSSRRDRPFRGSFTTTESLSRTTMAAGTEHAGSLDTQPCAIATPRYSYQSGRALCTVQARLGVSRIVKFHNILAFFVNPRALLRFRRDVRSVGAQTQHFRNLLFCALRALAMRWLTGPRT